MKPMLFSFILMSVWSVARAQYVPLESRIKDNLYITVEVNKSEVYPGEPIVATYKLYSALESVSTVIKQPLFHGFEYKDIITPRDNVVSRENIDGAKFDVHLIKKVQLTPYEAGTLELDALLMSNKIRVTDEQGRRIPLLDGLQEDYIVDDGYLHFTVSSVPIHIHVITPSNTERPLHYNGAVGKFSMSVQLSKTALSIGEQGTLTIIIMGNGDFSKVQLPAINWPAGLQIAAPMINEKDVMNNGFKAFAIPFTANMEGTYTIMPIQFSYFDTLTNRLHTITNRPLIVHIRNENDKNITLPQIEDHVRFGKRGTAFITLVILIVILLLILIVIGKKKNNRRITPVQASREYTPPIPSVPKPVEDCLRAAAEAVPVQGNVFYTLLKQGIINFFEHTLPLAAVLFNRTLLKQVMADKKISAALQEEILSLLTEIEMNIYGGGGLDTDKNHLLQRTKDLLTRLYTHDAHTTK